MVLVTFLFVWFAVTWKKFLCVSFKKLLHYLQLNLYCILEISDEKESNLLKSNKEVSESARWSGEKSQISPNLKRIANFSNFAKVYRALFALTARFVWLKLRWVTERESTAAAPRTQCRCIDVDGKIIHIWMTNLLHTDMLAGSRANFF